MLLQIFLKFNIVDILSIFVPQKMSDLSWFSGLLTDSENKNWVLDYS